jgi:hypothetical protein
VSQKPADPQQELRDENDGHSECQYDDRNGQNHGEQQQDIHDEPSRLPIHSQGVPPNAADDAANFQVGNMCRRRMTSMRLALTGMIALYAVSALVFRAGGSERSVTHALADAAQLNAARIAAPPQARVPPTGRSVTALEISGPL